MKLGSFVFITTLIGLTVSWYTYSGYTKRNHISTSIVYNLKPYRGINYYGLTADNTYSLICAGKDNSTEEFTVIAPAEHTNFFNIRPEVSPYVKICYYGNGDVRYQVYIS